MKKVILFGIIMMLLIVPEVQSIGGCTGDHTPSCLNDNILLCDLEINYSGNSYHFNHTIYCPEGCVNSSFEGTSFCREPVKPITSHMFILFEVVAIAMLMFSMIRKKEQREHQTMYTYQHGVVSLVATILFFGLSMLSTEIIVVYMEI